MTLTHELSLVLGTTPVVALAGVQLGAHAPALVPPTGVGAAAGYAAGVLTAALWGGWLASLAVRSRRPVAGEVSA